MLKKKILLNHMPLLILTSVSSGAFNLETQQPLGPYLLNAIRKSLSPDVMSAHKQMFDFVSETGTGDFKQFFQRSDMIDNVTLT